MSYFDQLMKQAKENDTKKLGGRSDSTTSPASPVSGKLSRSSDNFSLLMKQARKNDNRRIAGTQFGFGNIDLTSRPSFRNADGSISTVGSASYNIDGKEVLLPTVWVKDGKAYLLVCNLSEKPLDVAVALDSGAWRMSGTEVGTPATMKDARTVAFYLDPIGVSLVRLDSAR